MSWSISGANNLAKLLAERASGMLYERLNGLLQDSVTTDSLEEILEVIQLSAAQVNKKPKFRVF